MRVRQFHWARRGGRVMHTHTHHADIITSPSPTHVCTPPPPPPTYAHLPLPHPRTPPPTHTPGPPPGGVPKAHHAPRKAPGREALVLERGGHAPGSRANGAYLEGPRGFRGQGVGGVGGYEVGMPQVARGEGGRVQGFRV